VQAARSGVQPGILADQELNKTSRKKELSMTSLNGTERDAMEWN